MSETWQDLADLHGVSVDIGEGPCSEECTYIKRGKEGFVVMHEPDEYQHRLPGELIELHISTQWGEEPDFYTPSRARDLSACLLVAAAYVEQELERMRDG